MGDSERSGCRRKNRGRDGGGCVLSREQPGPTPGQTCPERWVDEHGDYLYCFALARVNDPEAAEDLVQETFLAALKAVPSFAGQSTERTWLTSILKNKLVDRLRQRQRAGLVADLGRPDECVDGLYDRAGHWKAGPRDWEGDPARALERQEFWEAFQHCYAHLPDRLREVFSLRLLDGVSAPEVCQVLGISATNLWALVHRARVRLWHCLNRTGFG
jgi:RNA polymerase sigma-70 factor (TIGR02943 family)